MRKIFFMNDRANNRMVKGVILFCVMFSVISAESSSQTGLSGLKSSAMPAASGEKISLLTDRHIYCVNERICFTAEYSCIDELRSFSWSNVLYVELISWDGKKLAQMKLALSGTGASGVMEIPGNVISGNYYLRAYTKWMRNYSVYEYAYLPVKIVNPFRSETYEGPALKSSATAVIQTVSEQKTIICTTDKNEYKPREKAEVSLSIKDRKLIGSGRYCVSIVKAGTIDTTVQSFMPVSGSPESNLSSIEYLPEIRGITISGEITDRSSRLPLKDVLVSLSETRHGEYYAAYKTNDRGRFVFSLPDLQGQYDFFIQADSPSEILIDYGYCNKPVKLPFVAFSLNKDEADIVREMVINQQLSERYLPVMDTRTDSLHMKTEPLVFYGSKKAVYYTDKYIELPNIEEFVNEIVLEAFIASEKKKGSFISMKRADYANHLPLVLLDNIQVSNNDQFLRTPLNKIEKVEVINMDYAAGGVIYSGIMSFYSRNKDIAGLDLNKNSMFFTYDLFSDTDPVSDFSKGSSDSRFPDRRNLLYWNPDIQLSTSKETIISFSIPDCKGDYIVYVRRKNSIDGREIDGRCYFSVK